MKRYTYSVLFDQMTAHTRKFIKILLSGEQYPGEYKNCKEALEMIQKQLLWEEENRNAIHLSVFPRNYGLVK